MWCEFWCNFVWILLILCEFWWNEMWILDEVSVLCEWRCKSWHGTDSADSAYPINILNFKLQVMRFPFRWDTSLWLEYDSLTSERWQIEQWSGERARCPITLPLEVEYAMSTPLELSLYIYYVHSFDHKYMRTWWGVIRKAPNEAIRSRP
jgi:hypothetical protein